MGLRMAFMGRKKNRLSEQTLIETFHFMYISKLIENFSNNFFFPICFYFLPPSHIQIIDDDSPTCVWYGVCHVNPLTNHKLYCSNETKALPLEPEGQKLLSVHCPHLLNGRDSTYTCCDSEQVIYINFRTKHKD